MSTGIVWGDCAIAGGQDGGGAGEGVGGAVEDVSQRLYRSL
jgi:hypothetical protein